MRYLSQTKAAKLAGVSRGTIANRIGDGVLSASPEGIDPAELVRVFPAIEGAAVEHFLVTGKVADEAPSSPVRSAADDRSSPGGSPGTGDGAGVLAMAHRLEAVEEEARWLRGLIERRERELATVRSEAQTRLDEREAWWRDQLASVRALLPAPTPPRGLWSRLFG